jgi:hypothetical protein
MPIPVRRSEVRGPTPVAHRLEHPLGLEHAQAVGLVEVGGDLGAELVGRDADRADEADLVAHPLLHLASARLRRRALREVQIGLVEAGDLHAIAESPQHLHHLGRGAAVERHVARDQHGLWTAAMRGREGEGGVHAELARLV